MKADGSFTGSPQRYDSTAKNKKKALKVSIALRVFSVAEPAKNRGPIPTVVKKRGNQNCRKRDILLRIVLSITD